MLNICPRARDSALHFREGYVKFRKISVKILSLYTFKELDPFIRVENVMLKFDSYFQYLKGYEIEEEAGLLIISKDQIRAIRH